MRSTGGRLRAHMKASRIVKAAHRRSGSKLSLKAFARITPERRAELKYGASAPVGAWLRNKAKQRKRRPSAGHRDVHAIAEIRSTRHACGGSAYLRGEVRS